MTRLEIVTEALAEAWRLGEPDGLLFRALMEAIDNAG